MICRTHVSTVAESMKQSIIMQTPTGFFAKLPDKDYFQITSHSKHGLEPALRSGIDYEFFTVEKRGKKEKKEMDDGKLLHCLTLEKADFDNQYHVAKNYDEMYRDHTHYFSGLDDFKSAVSAHNKKYSALSKLLKDAVTTYNQKIKSNKTEVVVSYEELPKEYQTAKLTDAAQKKAIKQFKTGVESLNPHGAKGNSLRSTVASLYELMYPFIQNEYNESQLESLSKANVDVKRDVLCQMKVKLLSVINDTQPTELIKLVPECVINTVLTKASKDKAIAAYKKQCASEGKSPLNAKSALETMYEDLKAEGALPEEAVNAPKAYMYKMYNVGAKKSEQEVYSVPEVIKFYEGIYKVEPIIGSLLIETEKEAATKAGKALVTTEQYEHALRIVKQVYANPDASKILNMPNNLFEVAMFWNEEIEHESLSVLTHDDDEDGAVEATVRRVLCKAKIDIANLDYNVFADIKFVTSVDFDKMCRNAAEFNYHMQDAFYTRGFDKVCSSLPDGAQSLLKFVFILVEKDAPSLGKDETKPVRIRVGVYKPEHRERANELIDAALLEVEHWEETGEYDGFEGVEDLYVPVYQVRKEMQYLAKHKSKMQGKVIDGQPKSVQSPNDAVATSKTSTPYPDFDELVSSAKSDSGSQAA